MDLPEKLGEDIVALKDLELIARHQYQEQQKKAKNSIGRKYTPFE